MIPSTLLSFPYPLPPANPNPRSSSRPSSLPLIRRLRCRASGPSWDPNAESVSGRFEFLDDLGGGEDAREFQSSRKRRWWSDDDPSDGLDEEFDPFDEEDDNPWDQFWIFKVFFRSYGYLLPAIIASLLLSTGPNAFLMALALPLAQSALSLAVEKVWGKARESPRTKPGTNRKSFVRSSTDFRKQEQEENSSDHRGRPGYQSWVSAEQSVADKGHDSRAPSYGGWDVLDKQRGSTRKQPATASWSTQAEQVKKGKLSKRGRYREVPLFLRLLIAVFPFLGSWTKIL